ncbi:calcium/sodium antiporter [Parvularcula sp. LCG005]|uniref:calcium/sodium antiporter n=1 Tax=Parvularcula sp. LCG005 TaxID=3078805 RepID=UPI002941CFD2|nr:calcium/sodium antiporter [Parvularcula sp. LCG005]WOI54752.1 calcium/sodium antiporter [Parvularcula sp. LCG005]
MTVMWADVLFVALGLAGLVFGGDILVRGGTGLSLKFGLSPAVIGVVVLGFGTSTPELVTSLTASLSGVEGVAVGNVVGSNIANVLLILGLTAIIFPVACTRTAVHRDGFLMLVFTAVTLAAMYLGGFPRLFGALLLVGLASYLFIVIRSGADPDDLPTEGTGDPLLKSGLFVLGGLVLLMIAANLLVRGASSLATAWGASEALIGLTVVAVGTSLPELSASMVAAFRRQGDMAFGNIVGSNIFNIAGVLGLTALIAPMDLPPGIGLVDAGAMAIAAILAVVFGLTAMRIVRWEGAVLLAGYVGYLAITIMADRAVLG